MTSGAIKRGMRDALKKELDMIGMATITTIKKDWFIIEMVLLKRLIIRT